VTGISGAGSDRGESAAAQTPLPPCPWCGGKLDEIDLIVRCENGCEKHPTLGPLGTRDELWNDWQDHLSRPQA
jgi:hypothetical protein